MTRSLLLTNSFAPGTGGVERLLTNIARYTPQDRLEVLTHRVPGAEQVDSQLAAIVHRVDRAKTAAPWWLIRASPTVYRTWPFLQAAHRRCRSRPPVDCIQCGTLKMGLTALILQLRWSLPYFVYTHGGEMAPPYGSWRSGVRRLLRKIVLRRATAVFANSAYTRDQVAAWDVPLDRIHVIPLGADRVTSEGSALRESGSSSVKTLLTVARLVELKGHDLVIRSLARVRQRVPRVRYVIVGDGPNRQRLERLARAEGVGDHVFFEGTVTDERELSAHYQAADVFVMPSRVEGFGLAFLEASAHGKPVIGARSGGIADAVLHGETGFLVESENVDELAEAILSVLTDRHLATRLGDAGKRWVETERSWKNTAMKVQQVVDSCLDRV